VFFFTPEGRAEHDIICIGYHPNESVPKRECGANPSSFFAVRDFSNPLPNPSPGCNISEAGFLTTPLPHLHGVGRACFNTTINPNPSTPSHDLCGTDGFNTFCHTNSPNSPLVSSYTYYSLQCHDTESFSPLNRDNISLPPIEKKNRYKRRKK
jgi:hypothetical protein